MPLPFDITRLLRTPGFLEDDDSGLGMDMEDPRRPVALPELGEPQPIPTSTGAPGGDFGASAVRRPTRRAEMTEAEDVYMQGTQGRGRSALTGALQGLAAGGLGGALTGAATGAISPRTVRRQQFRQEIRPQIQEGFAAEDQQRQFDRQAEQDALGNEERRARIRATDRSNQPAPLRPRTPLRGRPGDVFLNPDTGQPMAQIPEQPREQTSRPITFEGRTYDYNNPLSRAQLEAAQSKVPRDKSGRFISRGDERATVRANAPKKAKEEPKVVSTSQVRKAADEHFGGDFAEAEAAFVRKGFRVVGQR